MNSYLFSLSLRFICVYILVEENGGMDHSGYGTVGSISDHLYSSSSRVAKFHNPPYLNLIENIATLRTTIRIVYIWRKREQIDFGLYRPDKELNIS